MGLMSCTNLEAIVTKLCSVEMDCVFTDSESQVISACVDAGSPPIVCCSLGKRARAVTLRQGVHCDPGTQQVTDSRGNTIVPQTGTTKEEH